MPLRWQVGGVAFHLALPPPWRPDGCKRLRTSRSHEPHGTAECYADAPARHWALSLLSSSSVFYNVLSRDVY